MRKVINLSKIKKKGQGRLGAWRSGNRRQRFLLVLTGLATLALVFLVVGSLTGLIVLAFYSKDLPSPDRLYQREMTLSTKIYDRDGNPLYDVYASENRTFVTLDEVSDHVINATLATEDAEFYRHRGFDVPGILRAAYSIVRGQGLQGGSTISQQVVKNTLLSSERTIVRKIKELVLSLQIEEKYTKDEILQMYLNEVPYGGTAWGIEAASEMYFGKPAKELTLAEATLLAGLPQRPSYYSPFGSYPEKALERQSYVVHLMESRGWIGKDGQHRQLSAEEAERARTQGLKFSAPGTDIKAPHFVMYVKQQLVDRYGEDMVERGGLQVITTLDSEFQEKAQEAVLEEITAAAGLDVGNGALVAIDPKTGEIRAMVGSKDYFDIEGDGNVNVVLSMRQPGSSIKPLTYVTAFRQGYTPATLLFDTKVEFIGVTEGEPYRPQNYDGKYRGPVQLRYGLGNSVNVIAIKLLKLVGVENMIQLAQEMGINSFTDPKRYGLALTLGGGEVTLLELTSAFSVFANQGVRHEPVAILEVKDHAGKILERYQAGEGREVLSQEEAYLISDILSDVNARMEVFGGGPPLQIAGYTVAVKTGTTDELQDNWTVGYTPDISIGVWVGNNDNHSMSSQLVSGLTGAAPIWYRAMVAFLQGRENQPFEKPPGIVEMEVCKLSGMVPRNEQTEKRWEKFIRGTEPTEKCTVHREFKVCDADNKLASELCEEVGDAEDKEFIVFTAALPEWQGWVDEWVEEHHGDDSKYKPPDEESRQYYNDDGEPKDEDSPEVIIDEPDDDAVVSGNFDIKVRVLSPYTVLKVEFYWDGEQFGKDTSIPYEQGYSVDPLTDAGPHKLRVRTEDSGGNGGSREIDITVQ